MKLRAWFRMLAQACAEYAGSPYAFLAALAVIVVWAITGPFLGFSDTWQLIINTFTTLVTFLMTFVIQHTQNRDTKALHLKLDELVRAQANARNNFIDIEHLDDEQLAHLKAYFDSQVRTEGDADYA
jgi:low affinity Fe/Cu permease